RYRERAVDIDLHEAVRADGARDGQVAGGVDLGCLRVPGPGHAYIARVGQRAVAEHGEEAVDGQRAAVGQTESAVAEAAEVGDLVRPVEGGCAHGGGSQRI